MTRLITGDKLTADLQAEVLRAYVHRWTHENAKQTYRGNCPGCEQSAPFPMTTGSKEHGFKTWTRDAWHAYHKPLTTDQDWLKAHAFHVTKLGRLNERKHYAEPAYLAEQEARP